MPMTAFEIIPDDVLVTFLNQADRVADVATLERVDDVVDEVFDGLSQSEFDEIERAALHAGTDISEQTDGAHEAIAGILERQGFLNPVPDAGLVMG